jgi:hypothetical protein
MPGLAVVHLVLRFLDQNECTIVRILWTKNGGWWCSGTVTHQRIDGNSGVLCFFGGVAKRRMATGFRHFYSRRDTRWRGIDVESRPSHRRRCGAAAALRPQVVRVVWHSGAVLAADRRAQGGLKERADAGEWAGPIPNNLKFENCWNL